jgi:hypothetical protein
MFHVIFQKIMVFFVVIVCMPIVVSKWAHAYYVGITTFMTTCGWKGFLVRTSLAETNSLLDHWRFGFLTLIDVIGACIFFGLIIAIIVLVILRCPPYVHKK